MARSSTTTRLLRATLTTAIAASLFAAPAACKKETPVPTAPGGAATTGGSSAAAAPVFSLAWSEYPSWSVFGVAEERGLIDGDEGEMGPIEKKHGVDLVLKQADYDPCLSMYASASTDAVCITNMDVLNPALGRRSVAIFPTSRSHGADALLTVGISSVEGLKGQKVYGLEKSVSEYCFVRNLEELGLDPAEFTFVNMDPGAAALAMQQGQDVSAIVVWNPFVMQTLKQQPESQRLFDSTSIPGEIVDMVVMSADSLAREGGPACAEALAEAFYEICGMLEDPATRDTTLVALGAKFSNLNAEEMAEVCEQTLFYATPADARALFAGPDLPATMTKVVKFCLDRGVVDSAPTLHYGSSSDANLSFDASHLPGGD